MATLAEVTVRDRLQTVQWMFASVCSWLFRTDTLPDYFEATKWFRLAAEQGNPIGQNVLGYMYYRGEGVSRDYRQAADWFLKAAEQNFALAQKNLGLLYQNGFGVPLNYGEAYKWLTLAVNGSSPASSGALQALTQIMTATQLQDGQARVSDWVSHHNNLELAAQKDKKDEKGKLDNYAVATQP